MKFFFQKDQEESKDLFIRFADACEGLLYVSETDAPVTPYAAPSAEAQAPGIILQHTGREVVDGVEEVSSDVFFNRLTTNQDWFGERETLRAKKFLELQELLEENLTELKVYRLGRIQVDIFVVGRDQNGLLMGVATKAIET